MARQAIPASTRADPPDDDVFFHKKQISVGVVLACVGRRDPNSRWRVSEIATIKQRGKGKLSFENVDTVEHLSDMVTLVRAGRDKTVKHARFGAMSYSAIWRIAREK